MSEDVIGAAALTGRYVVAFVMLGAAIPKLLDRREFERAVSNYALLPARLVAPFSRWLPRAELAVALMLLLGIAVSVVATLAGVLLLAFAAAVSMNLMRGRRIDCGCYSSVAPRRIGWTLVGGDLVLASVAFVAAVADPGALTLWLTPSASNASLSGEDGVAALMVGAVLVLGLWLVSSTLEVLRAVERLRRRQMREGVA